MRKWQNFYSYAKFCVEWERHNPTLKLNPFLSPFLRENKKSAYVGRASKELYDKFRAHDKLDIFLKLSYLQKASTAPVLPAGQQSPDVNYGVTHDQIPTLASQGITVTPLI